tara:strand:+ start:4222 stop:4959 length:738 start_codon:yes stop_codon:yes gene_type:complete
MNFNKALILAGGKGTRFEEQTQDIPKPMILAKNDPLLIHVMSIYIKHKITDFTILAGYKKEIITQYFQKNAKTISKLDAKYEMNNGSLVTVLDTGDETLTGGRIKIGLDYVDEDNVYITYGDGFANINITELTKFHKKHKKLVTLTAVKPPPRFGNIKILDDVVIGFKEKSFEYENWINGGFFLVNKSIKNYISDLNQAFEKEPLEKLISAGELMAYKHDGLFRPVDTVHELGLFEKDLEDNSFT